jgi:hypothetical protein
MTRRGKVQPKPKGEADPFGSARLPPANPGRVIVPSIVKGKDPVSLNQTLKVGSDDGRGLQIGRAL